MESGLGEAPVWEEEVRVRSYDVDATRRATSLSLIRYFFDAAWNHAEALGGGFEALQRQGVFWVLARFRWEAERYPEWGARVKLRTWPRGAKSAFALRDCEFLDEEGKRFAAGSSEWLVLSGASKRPQRLQKVLPDLAAISGRAAISREPEKLETLEAWDEECAVSVRYTDIDVNRHVNSSRYIGWALDAYPAGFHAERVLRALDVNYVAETLEGDQLTVRTRRTEGETFLHSMVKAGGAEVCRARAEWVRI